MSEEAGELGGEAFRIMEGQVYLSVNQRSRQTFKRADHYKCT